MKPPSLLVKSGADVNLTFTTWRVRPVWVSTITLTLNITVRIADCLCPLHCPLMDSVHTVHFIFMLFHVSFMFLLRRIGLRLVTVLLFTSCGSSSMWWCETQWKPGRGHTGPYHTPRLWFSPSGCQTGGVEKPCPRRPAQWEAAQEITGKK